MVEQVSHSIEQIDLNKDQQTTSDQSEESKQQNTSTGVNKEQVQVSEQTSQRPQPQTRPQPSTSEMNQPAQKKKRQLTDSKRDLLFDTSDPVDESAQKSEQIDTSTKNKLQQPATMDSKVVFGEAPLYDIHRPYNVTDHRYFPNTDSTYLIRIRHRVKQLENQQDKSQFYKFISIGRAMIAHAQNDSVDPFMKLFSEYEDKELMYWHIQKSFKTAVKFSSLKIIEFIIEDLKLDLTHECFKDLGHITIFGAQEAEMEDDDLGMEVNRQVLRYLALGYGRSGIDCVNSQGTTLLHYACQYSTDLTIIEILADAGGDLNPVNNDEKMPLITIRERIARDQNNQKLLDIEEYLVSKGAKVVWRFGQ